MLALGLLAPLALGLLACTTTTSTAMVPADIELSNTHSHSIAIQAEGSGRRLGFAPAFVSSETLQATLEEAVLSTELFRALTTVERADYTLTVSVSKLDKPESGLDMTAGVELLWSLAEGRSGDIVWQKTLTTAHTASTRKSGMLDERLRASIEGAVRENIALGLDELSRLELDEDAK